MNGDTQTNGVTAATLGIQVLQPQPPDKLVNLSVQTDTDLLVEKQLMTLNVIVQNLAAFPIQVTAVQPVAPGYIILNPAQPQVKTEITPLESIRFQYQAKLGSSYLSGSQVLTFNVALQWNQNGQVFTANQIASKTITIGALSNLSGILQALSLPSFLVVPGFLFITLFISLWHRFPPKVQLDLEPKTGEFWMLVVTVSILAVPLYQWLTGLFGISRNYLVMYGLTDVVLVWSGSIAGGLLAYFLGLGIYSWRWRKIPRAEDSELTILRKLKRNGWRYALHQVDSSEKPGQRYFVFMQVPGDPGKVWVVPSIFYSWNANAEGDLKTQFSNELAKGLVSDAMIKLISQATRKHVLSVWWENHAQPFQADLSKIIKRYPPIGMLKDKSLAAPD